PAAPLPARVTEPLPGRIASRQQLPRDGRSAPTEAAPERTAACISEPSGARQARSLACVSESGYGRPMGGTRRGRAGRRAAFVVAALLLVQPLAAPAWN